jgi:hypothetical protein
MEYAILWIVLCIVAGSVGNNRNIGFAGAFFLSLFLSPLVGLILTFNSDKKGEKAQLSPAMRKLINEGDVLFRNKDIDNAIEKYKSALAYSDKAPMTNFKLAKLYSMKNEPELSLKYLAISIQEGYKNFDKINNDNELKALRNSAEFKTFVENGYRTHTPIDSKVSISRIEKLEKLTILYEKGTLTKEEFENEKKNILLDKES